MAKIKTTPKSRSHDHPFKPRKISARSFNQVYWPYLPVLFIIGLLLSLGVGQDGFRNPGGSVLSYASSMEDSRLLAETNYERSLADLPPLRLNNQLDQAADAKARDMATRNYWSHNTPEGKQPWVFVSSQNYSYQKIGENLATGFADERSAVNGWMASASHRANLLDPAYSEVGFGVVQIPNYLAVGGGPMTVVVSFYGAPSSGQPIISEVKGDTKSNDVSLAQLAVAKLPVVGLVTNILMLLSAGAILFWLGRHFRTLRKALRRGERFVITHPFLDVGLLTIAALSYLLTRTAGLIY